MKADRVGAIFTLGLGGLFLHQGWQLPPGNDGAPGSGSFPIWVGVALMVISWPLLMKPPAGGKAIKDLIPQGKERQRVLLAFLALVVYTILLKPLGFIIATFFLFLGLLQLLERGRWAVAIFISLAAILGSYWLFVKIFGLVLPIGVFSF